MDETPAPPVESGQRYIKEAKLGEGTYGEVYRGRDTRTEKKVAMKIMKLDQEEDGIPSTTLREMSILRSVNHVNIVGLVDVLIEPPTLVLITEYMKMDMRKFLVIMKGGLQLPLLKSYAFQMLAGLYVLHTHRIIHRDIKPENLLINSDGLLKICDFGLSRYFTVPMRQYSPNVVSTWYRAPELLFGLHFYDLEIDIWSCGCIIAEMAGGYPLFPGDSDLDQLHRIFRVLGTPSREEMEGIGDISEMPIYPPQNLMEILKKNDCELLDLIRKMLIIDPKKRITVQDALRHPFFADINPAIRDMCWPPELD